MIMMMCLICCISMLRRRLRRRAEARAAAEASDRAAAARKAAAARTAAVAALPTLAACAQPCSEAVCAVCLESYASGAVLKRLPCEHTFHVECVDAWLLGKVREFAENSPRSSALIAITRRDIC